MKYRIPVTLCLMALSTQIVVAQPKSDKKVVKQLKQDIGYLASDELQGRRTGSEGEKMAADYITKYYSKIGVQPYKGKFIYPFTFVNGKKINNATHININGKALNLEKEAFPLPFSGDGKVTSEILPDVYEQGNIWMISLFENEEEAKDPHFDWEKKAFERALEAKRAGATGVLFYDQYDAKYPAVFNSKSDYETIDIPVAYLTYENFHSSIEGSEKNIPVSLNIHISKTELTGHNIAGYIDNGAKYTVVIGAHYDHLGLGEDGNSLHAKKDGSIHNGADDNASGTAAVMQMASWIKERGLNNYNYLFLHFSGEELGLIGSKAFVKDMKLDGDKTAYMINMDMVGRLNDSTHALTVGGVGTSSVWGTVINNQDEVDNFKLVIDSSGVGPSDHTSFYHAEIPVLFFFTGTHSDYHKPSDDADKVNYEGEAQILHYIYDIVKTMENKEKPDYIKTKQTTVGKVRFKVTLGIMPDYSFQEGGVRIDGVSEDRPAMKAGLKAGDVIVKIGDYEISGMQSYMQALGEFEEGDNTSVIVLRDEKEMKFPLTFTPKEK